MTEQYALANFWLNVIGVLLLGAVLAVVVNTNMTKRQTAQDVKDVLNLVAGYFGLMENQASEAAESGKRLGQAVDKLNTVASPVVKLHIEPPAVVEQANPVPK